MRTSRLFVALGVTLGLLVGACSPGQAGSALSATHSAATPPGATPPTPAEQPTQHRAQQQPPAALRAGESITRVTMPAPYAPAAPHGGTDDYRCFLLDPGLASDSFVTGYDVLPGDTSVVHHVILFRVPPDKIALARAEDAATPGDGWTCFGGTGIERQGASLDDAPWLGAWAPAGRSASWRRTSASP